MEVYRHRYILVTAILAVIACTPTQDASNAPEDTPPAPEVTVETDIPRQSEETWVNPYPSYCFQRVGQIGADGNQDEPRRGDVCDVHGGGAGGLERGTGSAPRNTASLHIAAPSLKAIGMKSFSFSLNRKSADPKFTTGVHQMDQYDTLALQKANPLNAVLPDRLAFGSFAAESARKANMVIGEQYITGTLTISLIPLGSTGSQYGPTTFEFGRTIEWGYSNALYEAE